MGADHFARRLPEGSAQHGRRNLVPRSVPGLFMSFTGARKAARVGRRWKRKAEAGPVAFFAVLKWADDILAWAEQHSPSATGAYREAWRIANLQAKSWERPLFSLVNDHPAAKAIEFGSKKGYWIKPVQGKALKFMWGGNEQFAAIVWHPAVKPHGIGRGAVQYAASTFSKYRKFI